MANGKTISYSDLVDEGAFERAISEAEKFGSTMKAAADAVKQLAAANRSALSSKAPTNLSNVEETNKAIQSTANLTDAHSKLDNQYKRLTINVAQARLEQANYNAGVRELAKNNLGLVSEYQKQSQILNELRNRYKDLVLTNQQNTVEGKKLLTNVQQLDSKLKQVDATVGQHQRNVGNYSGAISKLGKGLGGVTGLLAAFGGAIGLNTEALQTLHETSRELIRTTRELHHATELGEVAEQANTVALNANTAAVETQTVAQEELTVATEETNAAFLATPLGIFVALAAGVAAVGFAIYEFTKSEKDSAEAIHIFNEAITKEREEINKLKASILETTIANDVLTKKESQNQADHLHQSIDSMKQEFEATEKHKQAIADLNKEYALKEAQSLKEQAAKRSAGDVFAGNGIPFYEEQKNKKLLELESVFQEHLSEIRILSAQKQQEISEKEILKDIKLRRDLITESITLEYDRKKQELINAATDEIEENKFSAGIIKDIQLKLSTDLKKLKKDELVTLSDLNHKYSDQILKDRIESIKDESQKKFQQADLDFKKEKDDFKKEKDDLILITKSKDKEISDAAKKDLIVLNLDIESAEKAHQDRLSEIVSESVDILNKKQIEEDKKNLDQRIKQLHDSEQSYGMALKTITTKRFNDGKIDKKEFDKQILLDDISLQDKIKENADKTSKEYADAELQREEDLKKIKELIKKSQAEEINATIETATKLLNIEKEYQDAKAKAKLDSINHDLDQNKSALEIQSVLAAGGQANTLAYELKRQDELEKARQKELADQKKHAQEMEAVELGLAFIKAYEADLSRGVKPAQALTMAATETIAAKVIGKAIGGSAYEGVEDTGGAGNLDNKGGKLWLLHPHEGVVNRRANEQTKGLVGAVNSDGYAGAVDWAMENIFKPQFNSSIAAPSILSNSNNEYAMLSALDNGFKSLERTIKNKVEYRAELDNMGNLIKKRIENGITKTTIKKRFLS